MMAEKKRKRTIQRFQRGKELGKLTEHHGGVDKFCERFGIHPKTLSEWLRSGIPHRFTADSIAIAALDPTVYDVLLDRVRMSGRNEDTVMHN